MGLCKTRKKPTRAQLAAHLRKGGNASSAAAEFGGNKENIVANVGAAVKI